MIAAIKTKPMVYTTDRYAIGPDLFTGVTPSKLHADLAEAARKAGGRRVFYEVDRVVEPGRFHVTVWMQRRAGVAGHQVDSSITVSTRELLALTFGGFLVVRYSDDHKQILSALTIAIRGDDRA